MRARDIWQAVLTTRYRTGEPYLFFIDHANDVLPETQKQLGLRINNSNLCSEITLPTNNERTAVCCLSSLNAEKYDDWKGTPLVADLITMLDNVLDYFIEYAQPELHKAVRSASLERSVGLGMMGFHSYLQSKMIPFESMAARNINDEMFRSVKSEAVKQSYRLGAERGEAPDMRGTGRRNAALLAVAPNANSAIILGTSPSIEPANANAYTHQTRAGSWPVKSRHLQSLLRSKGKDTDEVWQNIITSKGSVQHLDFLTPHEKAVFKTAIELDQMWIVQLAADRQKYICQSQSLNLFFPPNVDKAYFNRVHVAAWRKGLKSLYYTRTMTPHVVKSVSEKIVRVALKDGVDATLITPKSVEELEEALSEGDCVSCQG
jgi:ribonucleoside-diphosphate reductase alpha chain